MTNKRLALFTAIALLAIWPPPTLAQDGPSPRLSPEIISIVADSLRPMAGINGDVGVLLTVRPLGVGRGVQRSLHPTLIEAVDGVRVQRRRPFDCPDGPRSCRMLDGLALSLEFSTPTKDTESDVFRVRVNAVAGSRSARTPVSFAEFEFVFRNQDGEVALIEIRPISRS